MFLIPNSTIDRVVRYNTGAYGGDPYRTDGKFGSVWSQAIYSCTVLNRYKNILLTKRKNNHKILQL